jgi:hypothetical protein
LQSLLSITALRADNFSAWKSAADRTSRVKSRSQKLPSQDVKRFSLSSSLLEYGEGEVEAENLKRTRPCRKSSIASTAAFS